MDDVLKGVKRVQSIFDTLPSKYLLMNGNIEKNLKFFVGMVLEGMIDEFSYVMDKKIESHEVDMIGFVRGESVLAVEFKCTFSSDPGATVKAAKDACVKIKKTNEIGLFNRSWKKIVHFLNHSIPCSSESLNPDYIKRKFPNGKKVGAEKLVDIFRLELGDRFEMYNIHSYKFSSRSLGLDAIVIDIS